MEKIGRKIFAGTIIWIMSIQIVFWLTTSQAGKILENFKRQEKEMIFESDAALLDDADKSILNTYRRLNVYKNIGDRIQSKREYLENQSEKIISRASSLEASIAELDADINTLVAEVNSINQQIIDTKQKIEVNKETIDLLKRKIADNTEVLLEYMIYLYKKWSYVSSENDIDNLKTILLSGENIDELVNDLYFTSIIQLTGQQLIDKHRKYISTLYVKKLDLQKSEDDLKALRKIWVLEKNVLDDKRDAKKRLLEVTKGQEELYDKYIEEKIEIEKDVKVKELKEQIRLNNTKKQLLQKYNCEFVDVSIEEAVIEDLSQQCLEINKIIYAESRLSWVPVINNPFDWPVFPYAGISSFFRDEGYKAEFWTNHDAIDIVIPQGTEITAPADGYVIYLQPPVNSGYAYVALKHSDELVTLYGHVTEVTVGKYDFVKKWEVFAKSGGEYGTPGAGVLTTGPHLHFVVYEKEEYADPLEYLNLSYLNFNMLPEKYEYKYKSDFRSRKWYEYVSQSSDSGNRFRIEWDTEVERQKYLLDTYAVGPFRDWDIWVEESIGWNIDPTFMMCVWLAETSLWKHLKTPYNIWNVWNTDSWSTYSFTSAREWIHWMTETFNNRFLSQYDEILQLSRYGNKDEGKPIYASSDFNWHNNITKCMSHVKGEYVPDDYNFRINQY